MKKIFGLVFFIGGMIGSLLIGSKDPVNWVHFGAGIAAILLGCLLLRMASKAKAREDIAKGIDAKGPHDWLEKISKTVKDVSIRKSQMKLEEIGDILGRLYDDDMNDFVAAKDSIQGTYGLENYVDIMTSYSQGERFINRAWAAAVDGYIDESYTYIDKALVPFEEALGKLNKIHNEMHG